MKYLVKKTDVINPGIDSEEWNRAELGYINKEPWLDKFTKAPDTTFKMLKGPEGLSILMRTNETHLRQEVCEDGGPICTDSCMEFFYKPSPWDLRYLNFEINPKGFLHLGLRMDRHNKDSIHEDKSTFDIVSQAKEGDWTLKFYIPDSFIEKTYPDLCKQSGGNSSKTARGNFYKCGDKTDHMHYASWSEIITEKPDFHVPDFFGRFVFEE